MQSQAMPELRKIVSMREKFNLCERSEHESNVSQIRTTSALIKLSESLDVNTMLRKFMGG